jgi:succinate-acetate transporter protein
LSYGIIVLPASGFFAAAEGKGLQTVSYAIGLFELPWYLLALVLFFGTLRQAMNVRVIHAAIVLLFLTGSLGGFTQIIAFTKVSGWIAVLLSLHCLYTSAALMYSPRITPHFIIYWPAKVIKNDD